MRPIQTPGDDQSEIVSFREIPTETPGRIKVKIKERVSRRKKKTIPLLIRFLLLVAACLIGFYTGEKLISKYFNYWNKPQIQYRDTQNLRSSEIEQLKAGQVYSSPTE